MLEKKVTCIDCGAIVHREICIEPEWGVYWICPRCGVAHEDHTWYRHITEPEARDALTSTKTYELGRYVHDTGFEVIGLDNRYGDMVLGEFPDVWECLDWLARERPIRKQQLEMFLMEQHSLADVLPFTDGQECVIYKAPEFEPGDTVLYIPDLDLNDIPTDAPLEDIYDRGNVLGCCYTGDDFIYLCDGDEKRAEELFWYCDWQHPASAVDELFNNKNEEERE